MQTALSCGFTTVVSTGERLDNDDNWSWRAAVTLKPTEDLENYFLYTGSFIDTRQASSIISAGTSVCRCLTLLVTRGACRA